MLKRNSVAAVRGRKQAAERLEPAPKPKSAIKPARKKTRQADVRITHPERIVFPGTGYTKQHVADYYRAVMPWMLPELAERPLSLLRCPSGAGSACFFQKHNTGTLGGDVRSISIREKDGASDSYLYIDTERGVLELVQMNALEFHPWGARVDNPERPDRLVFDLDPAPGIDWKTLKAAALEVREHLGKVGLESFVRLSGGKGMHVVAPIRRGPSWDEAKAFCEALAGAMATLKPARYLATASKAKRQGRIFIDWLRNARGATSVASWSLRAREGAPVSMPLRWEELAKVSGPAAFDLAAAMKRAKSLRKDPWEGFAELRQSLPKLGSARR
ncbi:MAG: non-homologous end-joining DNA ligase [Rhodanobacteraceae bacterium]